MNIAPLCLLSHILFAVYPYTSRTSPIMRPSLIQTRTTKTHHTDILEDYLIGLSISSLQSSPVCFLRDDRVRFRVLDFNGSEADLIIILFPAFLDH